MEILYFFLILTSINVILVTCTSSEELPEIISNEVEKLKTHKFSHTLARAVSDLKKIKDKKLADDMFCLTCDLVMEQILTFRSGGASKDSMINFLGKLCRGVTDWGAEACDGYIGIEIDTVLYIIDNKRGLTSKRICGIYFQSRTCVDPNAKKWVVPIPPKRKSHHNHHHAAAANPLKILHLTDFHYDPLYSPGSNSECAVPLCCQVQNGPAPKPSQAAGYWGDYHVCDTPWHAITNFTAYLTNLKEKYDLVYYTGDIISHRSWASNVADNTNAIKTLFKHFNETFKETTLYPIVGNHESHPTDFWSYPNVTPSVSTRWIFDLMGAEWTSRWLPAETNTTIRAGGYYTVLVRSKLRIIALNSNVCFNSNLWLIYDDEDPYGQLKWLVDILVKAETSGEIVHILSHIPPGHELCLQQWSNQFRKIVQRFAPIIAAQFNGHTHLDELRLFRDVNDTKKIINVAFNGGSFTTFVGYNPNYRTYDVDGDNFRVLDYQHYTYNLTKANLNKDKVPEWYKLYSFKDAYGLKNTTNEGLADLIERMTKNHTLVQQYFRYQGRESDPTINQKCSDLCLTKLLCAITAVETAEAIHCEQLTKKKPHYHHHTHLHHKL